MNDQSGAQNVHNPVILDVEQTRRPRLRRPTENIGVPIQTRVGAGDRTRTCTPLREEDSSQNERGDESTYILIRRPVPFTRITRSALQSEGYGHPGGHLSWKAVPRRVEGGEHRCRSIFFAFDDVDGMLGGDQRVAGHAAPRRHIHCGPGVARDHLECFARVQRVHPTAELEDELPTTCFTCIPAMTQDRPFEARPRRLVPAL
jgi:hypothetical protein